MAEVIGECPTCQFPIKDGYPLAYCPKCGKDLPGALVTAPPPPPPVPRVTVVDISMPFDSMVRFMLKWAIASIPAAVILATFGALLVIAWSWVSLLLL